MSSRIPKAVSFVNDAALKKAGRGSHEQIVRQDDKVSLLKWYDSNGIYLASTQFGVQPVGECRRWSKKDNKYILVECPHVVSQYNTFMGGVDLLDRVIAKYAIRTRTGQWTKRTIFQFFTFV